jgi:hypothetical protein
MFDDKSRGTGSWWTQYALHAADQHGKCHCCNWWNRQQPSCHLWQIAAAAPQHPADHTHQPHSVLPTQPLTTPVHCPHLTAHSIPSARSSPVAKCPSSPTTWSARRGGSLSSRCWKKLWYIVFCRTQQQQQQQQIINAASLTLWPDSSSQTCRTGYTSTCKRYCSPATSSGPHCSSSCIGPMWRLPSPGVCSAAAARVWPADRCPCGWGLCPGCPAA